MNIFFYQSAITYVLAPQKNPPIETVLLSTQNICFGLEIRKYTLITYMKACIQFITNNYVVPVKHNIHSTIQSTG